MKEGLTCELGAVTGKSSIALLELSDWSASGGVVNTDTEGGVRLLP